MQCLKIFIACVVSLHVLQWKYCLLDEKIKWSEYWFVWCSSNMVTRFLSPWQTVCRRRMISDAHIDTNYSLLVLFAYFRRGRRFCPVKTIFFNTNIVSTFNLVIFIINSWNVMCILHSMLFFLCWVQHFYKSSILKHFFDCFSFLEMAAIIKIKERLYWLQEVRFIAASFQQNKNTKKPFFYIFILTTKIKSILCACVCFSFIPVK